MNFISNQFRIRIKGFSPQNLPRGYQIIIVHLYCYLLPLLPLLPIVMENVSTPRTAVASLTVAHRSPPPCQTIYR